MAERDGSAVHVYLLAVETQFFFDSKVLGGESFVDFNQIDVIEREAGLLERELGGGYRATAHQLWFDAGNSPTDDAAERFQSTLESVLDRHQHDGGPAIHNATGVTGRYSSILAECRLELSQTFHR